MKKTKFRKFISILLTVVMVLSVSPVGELAGIDLAKLFSVSAAAEESGTWSNGDLGSGTWSIDENGKLTLSGTGVMPDYSTSNRSPWDVYYSDILSAEITAGITKIGNYCFNYCYEMTDVTIPEGVTSIGSRAFCNCSSLTGVTLPGSVTTIGNYAFYGCSELTGITVPAGVTSIGISTFYGCSGLTDVTLPGSVTSVGNYAFYDCSSLTDVYYPGTESEWNNITVGSNNAPLLNATKHYSYVAGGTWSNGSYGSGTWEIDANGKLTVLGRGRLPDCLDSFTGEEAVWSGYYGQVYSVEIGNGITRIGNNSFNYFENMTSLTLPSGLQSIGYGAFCYCFGLSEVAFPDSLATIEGNAFKCCSSLPEIVIPAGVTSIDVSSFETCGALRSISVASGNTVYDSRNNCNAVIETATDTLLFGCAGTTVIPGSVKAIGPNAFFDCRALTHLVIQDGVTSIGSHAFNPCVELEWIMIPDSMESIGNGAFLCCISLSDVYYAGTETQWNAIDIVNYRNDELFAANIHYGVTAFGNWDNGTLGSGTWLLDVNGKLTVSGQGKMCSYDNTSNMAPWYAYSSSITSLEVESGITCVGTYSFYRLSGLTSAVLPGTLTAIDYCAFLQCTALEEINLPENLTGLGINAFGSCSSLSEIVIPDGVTKFDNNVFYYCTSLTEINVPKSLTTIHKQAFIGCSALAGITVDPENTVFDSRNGCNAVIETATGKLVLGCSNTVIPDGVSQIGDNAFFGLGNLTEISIPLSVTTIGQNAFASCTGLTDVYYAGTSAQWNAITIKASNAPLTGAALHFAKYTVTLDADGGSCSSASIDVSADGTYGTLPVPVKSGLTFRGWYYNSTPVTAEMNTVYAGDHTLTAKWGTHVLDLDGFDIPTVGTSIGSYVTALTDNLNIYGSYLILQYAVYVYDGNGTQYTTSSTDTFSADNTYFVKVIGLFRGKNPNELEEEGAYFTVNGEEEYENVRIFVVTGRGTVFEADTVTFAPALSGTWENGSYGSGTWSVDGNGRLTVSGQGEIGAYNYDNPDAAPWYVLKDRITELVVDSNEIDSIGNAAFADYDNLEKVTLSGGVYDVGEWSFSGCTSLEKVVFLYSSDYSIYVLDVREYAFDGCTGLSKVFYRVSELESTRDVSICPVGNGSLSDAQQIYAYRNYRLNPIEAVATEDEINVKNYIHEADGGYIDFRYDISPVNPAVTWTVHDPAEGTDRVVSHDWTYTPDVNDAGCMLSVTVNCDNFVNGPLTTEMKVLSNLIIGGRSVTPDYCSNSDEGWSYSFEDNVLYLDNCQIQGTQILPEGDLSGYVVGIMSMKPLTVDLGDSDDDNYISVDAAGAEFASGLFVQGKLTFTGNGTLSVITENNDGSAEECVGIYCPAGVYVNDPCSVYSFFDSAAPETFPACVGSGIHFGDGLAGLVIKGDEDETLIPKSEYGEWLTVENCRNFLIFAEESDVMLDGEWVSSYDNASTQYSYSPSTRTLTLFGKQVFDGSRVVKAAGSNADMYNLYSAGDLNIVLDDGADITIISDGSNITGVSPELGENYTVSENTAVFVNGTLTVSGNGKLSASASYPGENTGSCALYTRSGIQFEQENGSDKFEIFAGADSASAVIAEPATSYPDYVRFVSLPKQGTWEYGPYGSGTWSFDYVTGRLTLEGTGTIGSYTAGNPAPWSAYASSITSVSLPVAIIAAGSSAFSGCNGITDVYYSGTETQWYSFILGPDNGSLEDAQVHYSTVEEGIWDNGSNGSGTWKLGENGKLTVEGTGKMPDYDDGAEPWYYLYSSITSAEFCSGITRIGAGTFRSFDCLSAVSLPQTLTEIGDNAFSDCTGLTQLVIPENVTTVGDGAFCDCSLLTSVNIPAALTNIGESAFAACSALEAITVDPENTVYDSRNNCNAIIETATGTLIIGCKNTSVPSGVVKIGYSAFEYCDGLRSISIPESVTCIGEAAFAACSSLTGIILPGSVTTIERFAFISCSNLTDVYYSGTSAQWNDVAVREGNGVLDLAHKVYCYGPYSVELPDTLRPGMQYNVWDYVTSAYGFDIDSVPFENVQVRWMLSDGINSRVLSNEATFVPDESIAFGTVAVSVYADNFSEGAVSDEAQVGSYITIGGTSVTYSNCSVPSNHWSYDFATDTLTLSGASVNAGAVGDGVLAGIYTARSVNIVLEGNNTVNVNPENSSLCVGISSLGDITFSGTGSLSVITGDGNHEMCAGISAENITFSGTGNYVLDIGSGNAQGCVRYGIVTSDGSVTVNSVCSISVTMRNFDSSSAALAYGNNFTVSPSTLSVIMSEDGERYTEIQRSEFGSIHLWDIPYLRIEKVSASGVSLNGTEIQNFDAPDGSYYYNPFTQTLTLYGTHTFTTEYAFNVSSSMRVIAATLYSLHDLNIVLADDADVTLSAEQSKVPIVVYGTSTSNLTTEENYGIYVNGELTISGSGRLTVQASNARTDNTAIKADHTVTLASDAFGRCLFNVYAGSSAYNAVQVSTPGTAAYVRLEPSQAAGCPIKVINNSGLVIDDEAKTVSGFDTFTDPLQVRYMIGTNNLSAEYYIDTNSTGHVQDGDELYVCNGRGEAVAVYTMAVTRYAGGMIRAVSGSGLTVDEETHLITGIYPFTPVSQINSLVELTPYAANNNCYIDFDKFGPGSYVGSGDSVVVYDGYDNYVTEFEFVLYGDVNGDGAYDGQDAVLVNCRINGMLDEHQFHDGEWMAADVNHDGYVNDLDVQILEHAGVLRTEIEQLNTAELQSSSVYQEYISLIDQNPDDGQSPAQTGETEEETPDAPADFLSMLIAFIKSVVKMILSFTFPKV